MEACAAVSWLDSPQTWQCVSRASVDGDVDCPLLLEFPKVGEGRKQTLFLMRVKARRMKEAGEARWRASKRRATLNHKSRRPKSREERTRALVCRIRKQKDGTSDQSKENDWTLY